MEEYVYHRVPYNMIGRILYPLNALKEINQELYEYQVQKYIGREHTKNKRIDKLKCNWGDVVFLSPIHPKIIRDEIESVGFPKNNKQLWIKIPLNDLELDNIVVDIDEDKFEFLKKVDFSKLKDLPEKTKQYYRDTYKKGGNPLILAYAPHLMYKGVIDISNYEVFEV